LVDQRSRKSVRASDHEAFLAMLRGAIEKDSTFFSNRLPTNALCRNQMLQYTRMARENSTSLNSSGSQWP
jgi:hypothetical protein